MAEIMRIVEACGRSRFRGPHVCCSQQFLRPAQPQIRQVAREGAAHRPGEGGGEMAGGDGDMVHHLPESQFGIGVCGGNADRI